MLEIIIKNGYLRNKETKENISCKHFEYQNHRNKKKPTDIPKEDHNDKDNQGIEFKKIYIQDKEILLTQLIELEGDVSRKIEYEKILYGHADRRDLAEQSRLRYEINKLQNKGN
jgi:hypothetical protein